MLLLQVTQAVADSLQVAADNLDQAIANADGLDKLSLITQQLLDAGVHAGASILKAILVFIVGRFLVSMLNKLTARMMDKRHVDISIKTFVKSLVNILLTVLLIISVVGALGVLHLLHCWHLPVWPSVWLCRVIFRTLQEGWSSCCLNPIRWAIGLKARVSRVL